MSTGKSKLDTGLVRELAAILRDADLGEVEVEHEVYAFGYRNPLHLSQITPRRKWSPHPRPRRLLQAPQA